MTKKQVTKTENTASNEWTGAFNAFEKAFDAILKNPQLAVAFVIAYIAPTILSSSNTMLFVLSGLVQLIFLLAIPLYCLALADGSKPTLKHLFQLDVKKYIYLLLAGVLFLLILGVSLLLLIFPVIWALAWIFSMEYVVADKGLSPMAALKESKRLGANHKGKVWGIVGVTFIGGFGAGLIGALPYGQYLGTLAMGVITLVSSVAGAMLYRWLQKNNEVTETENA
jgi:hypothetical protein